MKDSGHDQSRNTELREPPKGTCLTWREGEKPKQPPCTFNVLCRFWASSLCKKHDQQCEYHPWHLQGVKLVPKEVDLSCSSHLGVCIETRYSGAVFTRASGEAKEQHLRLAYFDAYPLELSELGGFLLALQPSVTPRGGDLEVPPTQMPIQGLGVLLTSELTALPRA